MNKSNLSSRVRYHKLWQASPIAIERYRWAWKDADMIDQHSNAQFRLINPEDKGKKTLLA
jgi:hypothetical protein